MSQTLVQRGGLTDQTIEAGREALAGRRRGLRGFLPFAGPAVIASIAYMDPGNFATNIQGGAQFGYLLLWVVVLANLVAMLFQALSAKLGIVTGRSLAQLCRSHFPRPLVYAMWAASEVAAMATDLAESLGAAIGLSLLFGLPLLYGLLITFAVTYAVLLLQGRGFRPIELVIAAFISVIGLCYLIELFIAPPDWGAVAFHAVVPGLAGPDSVTLAVGIIGATVMPHNLYLHSGVVQTRRFGDSVEDRREAIKLATIDSTIALMFALTINAAILILAAATFNKAGKTDVAELDQAHAFLAPLLGSAIAPTLFGIALLCCGLNSTVTATLSGQIVMEGFIDIRLPAWARRLITRAIAITPAAIVTIWYGESGTAKLLILSQVVLGIALPFSIIPLVMFTADRRKMGALAAPIWVTVLATLTAALLIALNFKLLADQLFR